MKAQIKQEHKGRNVSNLKLFLMGNLSMVEHMADNCVSIKYINRHHHSNSSEPKCTLHKMNAAQNLEGVQIGL